MSIFVHKIMLQSLDVEALRQMSPEDDRYKGCWYLSSSSLLPLFFLYSSSILPLYTLFFFNSPSTQNARCNVYVMTVISINLYQRCLVLHRKVLHYTTAPNPLLRYTALQRYRHGIILPSCLTMPLPWRGRGVPSVTPPRYSRWRHIMTVYRRQFCATSRLYIIRDNHPRFIQFFLLSFHSYSRFWCWVCLILLL